MDDEKKPGEIPENTTLTPQPHGGALRPPFQPGNNANPDGRPKGAKNRSTILRELLAATVKDAKGKKKKNPLTGAAEMLYEEAIDVAIVKRALAGNMDAAREIKDTLHGKMKEIQQIIPPDVTKKEIDEMTDEEARALYESKLKR